MGVRVLVGSVGIALLLSGCTAAVPETQVVTVTATPEPTSSPSTATPTPQPVAATPSPSPTPTEAALPKVTAAEVKRIFLDYGLSYKKDSQYGITAEWLSTASQQERDRWLDTVVADSRKYNPGIADRITRNAGIKKALAPWIDDFARLAMISPSRVQWHKSSTLDRVRAWKYRTPPTADEYETWLGMDKYFLSTPGGEIWELERLADGLDNSYDEMMDMFN